MEPLAQAPGFALSSVQSLDDRPVFPGDRAAAGGLERRLLFLCRRESIETRAKEGGVLVLMLAAGWVYRLIGNSGASIISRVMGLILVSVATASVLPGMKQ